MHYTSQEKTITEYAGMGIYKNNKLQFINHPYGYIAPNENGYEYVYLQKDHLGNNRASYTFNTFNNSINIIQTRNYYPFGLQHKETNDVINGTEYPYAYNSKEEQKRAGFKLARL